MPSKYPSPLTSPLGWLATFPLRVLSLVAFFLCAVVVVAVALPVFLLSDLGEG